MTTVPAGRPRLGLRANAGQFALLVGVNGLVGGMLGQERTILPLIARDVFGLSAFTAHPVVHPGVRCHQGDHQPRRRRPGRPVRSQAGAGGRLARRRAGPAAADLGAGVGLGAHRERPARDQPGPGLVEHRDHEGRPRRAGPPRPGAGAERGGGLRRGRADRPRHGLHRRPGRASARAVLPRPGDRGHGPGRLRPVRARDARVRGPRGIRTRPAAPVADRVRVGPRSATRRSRPRRRPAWSTTSTTGWPGGSCRCSSRRTAWASRRSACSWRVYPAVWGIAQIGTGALSDRIGRKGLIVGGMLLQARAPSA